MEIGAWSAWTRPDPLPTLPRHVPIASPEPTLAVGQQLFGSVGLWVNGVLGYSYRLTRNGVVFQSGNWTDGLLYTVQDSDAGSAIGLIVMATNRSGSGPVATSAPVLVVGGDVLRLGLQMTVSLPIAA